RVSSSPLSDQRTKVHALEGLPSPDGGHRAERMARYKEERRRQLASQYGAHEEVAYTPQRRYITRSAVKNGDNSEQQQAKVRTTRTSRLRAAATSPTGMYSSGEENALTNSISEDLGLNVDIIPYHIVYE
ncbi:hypothetical protein L9F63_026933, partial [Diploptera punctata]